MHVNTFKTNIAKGHLFHIHEHGNGFFTPTMRLEISNMGVQTTTTWMKNQDFCVCALETKTNIYLTKIIGALTYHDFKLPGKTTQGVKHPAV